MIYITYKWHVKLTKFVRVGVLSCDFIIYENLRPEKLAHTANSTDLTYSQVARYHHFNPIPWYRTHRTRQSGHFQSLSTYRGTTFHPASSTRPVILPSPSKFTTLRLAPGLSGLTMLPPGIWRPYVIVASLESFR